MPALPDRADSGRNPAKMGCPNLRTSMDRASGSETTQIEKAPYLPAEIEIDII
jgi:hypothetical protein